MCAAGHSSRFFRAIGLSGAPMTALSILDLVRVTEDTDARGALDNARDLAAHAEIWGYRRIGWRSITTCRALPAARSSTDAGLSLMDTAFFICPSPFRFRLACLERRIVRFALRCSSSSFFSTPRA